MDFLRAVFLLIGMLVANVASVSSQAAFFDLRGTQGLEVDGLAFGSTTFGGITATLTANSGFLNQTTNRFGVNAAGMDDPDELDGGVDGLFPDSITITFNVDVFLDQIQLSVFSAGEEGSITIAGGMPISLTDTGVGADEYNFNSGNSVLTSESIVLSWVSGNGFSFDDFTVSLASPVAGDFDGDGDRDGADFLLWQRNPGVGDLADWEANFGVPPLSAVTTAVPEPASLLLALFASLGLLFRHRRGIR